MCFLSHLDLGPESWGLLDSVPQFTSVLWMDLYKTHLDGSRFGSPALPLRFGSLWDTVSSEQCGDATCLLGYLAMPGPQKSRDIHCETAPGLRLPFRLGVFLSKGFINYLVRDLLSSRTETQLYSLAALLKPKRCSRRGINAEPSWLRLCEGWQRFSRFGKIKGCFSPSLY